MDYQKAAAYWEEKDKTAVKLERTELLKEIETFIRAHNTCALATGYGDQVRCTPIEYTWMDGKFWLLSEGGKKFLALEHNKNVCLAIYDAYAGFGTLGGMQVQGTAEMIEPWSEPYLKLLEQKHIPAESLRKLPGIMHLIQVTPLQIDFLSSTLKEKGVSSRQQIMLP